jgi:hypothetical protein
VALLREELNQRKIVTAAELADERAVAAREVGEGRRGWC